MNETIQPIQKVEAVRRTHGMSPRDALLQDLQICRAISRVLDSQFEYAGIRFGLDALLGLIPVVGDVVSTAIGMYPIHVARKHRLGRLTVMRMMANLGADFLIGAVPLAGDAFDVFFKAHQKNFKLLESAAKQRGVTLDDENTGDMK